MHVGKDSLCRARGTPLLCKGRHRGCAVADRQRGVSNAVGDCGLYDLDRCGSREERSEQACEVGLGLQRHNVASEGGECPRAVARVRPDVKG